MPSASKLLIHNFEMIQKTSIFFSAFFNVICSCLTGMKLTFLLLGGFGMGVVAAAVVGDLTVVVVVPPEVNRQ
jgi:hypothetical protein